MQKYMKTTTFKYLELLEIEMREATSKLYNQDDIDSMSKEEYDALNKADNFFEENEIDFSVGSTINLNSMLPNENIFNSKLNFLMYEINEYLPKEKADWFYLNIYINDICPLEKDELSRYYQEHGKIKNSIRVINVVIDHYIECEAYRTMIYLLQENILIDVENTKKLLKYIIKIISKTDDNFTIYLNFIKDLILNKELFYALKKDYDTFKKMKVLDIQYDLYNKIIIENEQGEELQIQEKYSLNDNVYHYLKVPISIYHDVAYINIRNKIADNIFSIELDFILLDWSQRKDRQFSNLQRGLEVGLELLALSLHLKKIHNNKKLRVKDHILSHHNESTSSDLAILQTVYYFNEHNAHHLQFLVVPLSHYLALTYEESFKLLQQFGFYNHESANQEKGNFRKHFKSLQESYNSNFRYINNK